MQPAAVGAAEIQAVRQLHLNQLLGQVVPEGDRADTESVMTGRVAQHAIPVTVPTYVFLTHRMMIDWI